MSLMFPGNIGLLISIIIKVAIFDYIPEGISVFNYLPLTESDPYSEDLNILGYET